MQSKIRFLEASLLWILLQKDRIITSLPDRALKTEHMDVDHERSLLKDSKEDVRRIDKKNDYMDDRDRKDYRGLEHDSHKEHFFNNKKKLILKDDDSAEMSNQAREGDKFSGAIPSSSTYDEKGATKSRSLVSLMIVKSEFMQPCLLFVVFLNCLYVMTGHSQELAFVDRVKAKLDTAENQEFLRCLNLYSKEIISQPELQSLVCFDYEKSYGLYLSMTHEHIYCIR